MNHTCTALTLIAPAKRSLPKSCLPNPADHVSSCSRVWGLQLLNSARYIFTELATGGDLFSLLTRCQAFSELEVRWIIHQVLRGVVYIHNKGITHRDIKPENILCAVAPQSAYRIVLSDFGDSAITSSGRIRSEVGTSFYRAP